MNEKRFSRIRFDRRRAAVLLGFLAALVLLGVISALPTPSLADAGGFPTPTNTLPPIIIPTLTSTAPMVIISPTATAPIVVVGPSATITPASWIVTMTVGASLLAVTPQPPSPSLLARIWPLLIAIVLVALVVGFILWSTQRRSLPNP